MHTEDRWLLALTRDKFLFRISPADIFVMKRPYQRPHGRLSQWLIIGNPVLSLINIIISAVNAKYTILADIAVICHII